MWVIRPPISPAFVCNTYRVSYVGKFTLFYNTNGSVFYNLWTFEILIILKIKLTIIFYYLID